MNKRILNFQGTHREIGEQIGLQYKKWGKQNFYLRPQAKYSYPKQLSIYQKFFPQYLEYLEGIARGMDFPKELVFMYSLISFPMPFMVKPKNCCSTIACKNKNGILIGRNYDWRQSSEKAASLLNYKFTDSSSNNFTAITDMGTWKIGKPADSKDFEIFIDDAWNDQGLYIAVNGAPGNNNWYGMSICHVVQCVVEKCQTTKEAVELVSKFPISESKIFTIADKNGDFAIIEKSSDKGCFIRRAKDLIFTTNHFNHPKLTLENLSIFKDIPFHSTFSRYHYLQYSLVKEKDNIDMEKLINILSKPPVRQNWRGVYNGDAITVWTYALNLITLKYKIIFAPLLAEKTIIT